MSKFYYLNSGNSLPIPTKQNPQIIWQNIFGSALGLILSKLNKQTQKPIAIFCQTSNECVELENELRFFAPDLNILTLPDWEILPYDRFSPQKDIISERLFNLKQLPNLKQGIFIINAATSLQRLAPREFIEANTFFLQTGAKYPLETLVENLIIAGYEKVTSVFEAGSFAQRGGILDFFPMGAKNPFRLEWFDDELETIRTFDTQTQRSLERIEKIEILPAHEFAFDDKARNLFLKNFQVKLAANLAQSSIYQAVKQGKYTMGLEFFLPLFFEKTQSVFDYLPKDALVIKMHNLSEAVDDFLNQATRRYNALSGNLAQPNLKPEELYLSKSEFQQKLANWQGIEVFNEKVNGAYAVLEGESEKVNGAYAVSEGEIDKTETKSEKVNGAYTVLEGENENTNSTLFKFNTREVKESSTKKLADIEKRIAYFLTQNPQTSKIITSYSSGRSQRIGRILKRCGIDFEFLDSWQEFMQKKPKVAICITDADRSFETFSTFAEDCSNFSDLSNLSNSNNLPKSTEFNFSFLSEAFLLQEVRQGSTKQKGKARDTSLLIKSINELTPGCKVVHLEHGIGVFLGLETMQIGELQQDFVKIEYADSSFLYIPITNLDLISRYSGLPEDETPLSKLGTNKWQKQRAKAEKRIYDTAAELLHIQARRFSKKSKGFAFLEEDYLNFAAGFKFEETIDQKKAIEEVIKDLIDKEPMDRVICGDVGFGKTEIALRAAFIAASNSKQVAMLAPTTLLAEQHFNLFSDRFSDTGLRVASLSRFKTGKEQDRVLENLANGKLDIVIGTHKLLQPSVKFSDLGLLIVDEEHRFGVKQKEEIKKLRAEVNLLTLTATPIPRTLNMALGGIRDLSIIATPPEKRLSIKTFMREYNDEIIEEAIERELMRAGQVYFLHNEVKTIEFKKEELQKLMPKLRIGIAHGQMPERNLEKVMLEFYQHKYDLLLCSTIIENGIDVPNANTIIIERADKFGLAQLHQLRGRVGRSHHQAYAYLLTPMHATLTKDASARLEAIVSANELGSGFILATQDLEIRGSGSLLGEEQSGEIDSIGFNLYLKMLDKAVKAIKAGKLPDATIDKKVEVKIGASALLPAEYIGEINLRLEFYKKLAEADLTQIDELAEELSDRFGKLPQEALNLIEVSRIAARSASLGIIKLDINQNGANIDFAQDAKINLRNLVELVQSAPKLYQLRLTKLTYKNTLATNESRLKFADNLLETLEPKT